ncbi:MAG: class I SAM-dependent methyltransferase [Hahellaceae bacterium]|nr:class I SAM-dependent methyltransferase [Hahellaceae bacterium]
MSDLSQHLVTAWEARASFREQCRDEDTNAYRLFHGTNEGASGVTVDCYGNLVLIQSFHETLPPDDIETIESHFSTRLSQDHYFVYNDRSLANSRTSNVLSETQERLARQRIECRELGVKFAAQGRHRGQDPLLFLDFRAARRYIQANAAQKSVLNLFAYTCGIGVVAATSGASSVVNVDFAESSLSVGQDNARRNQIDEGVIEFIQSDFFTAAKQFAGLPVKARGNPKHKGKAVRLPPYQRFEERQFDLVVLDPPRWAKSPFGVVDLVRDYPSVLKPAVLTVKPGGELLCTNNVASVSREDWLDSLKRCVQKCGRTLRDLEVITPEVDFPTPDGLPPLKMAVLRL